MALTLGCIGCGNMGGAILGGLVGCGEEYSLYGFTRTMARLDPLVQKGVRPAASGKELVGHCRFVVLAVKPYQVESVVDSLRQSLTKDTVLISIAAGISLDTLRKASGGICPVVRCMPNTPALVSEGVFAFCFADPALQPEDKKNILSIFAHLGQCLEIPEDKFTAFGALIGAGPAYLFDLMEGMVQAGVALGFGHADCRRMVAALFAGCGRMALADEATHLMALRDNVCSPAGTTIAGVNSMDADGLAGKLARAVFAADARGREMEK